MKEHVRKGICIYYVGQDDAHLLMKSIKSSMMLQQTIVGCAISGDAVIGEAVIGEAIIGEAIIGEAIIVHAINNG